jgi:hypothetical protein
MEPKATFTRQYERGDRDVVNNFPVIAQCDRGNGAIFGVIAAMVIVMAVIAFTLHRNSPLVAAGPSVTTSEPSTTGAGGIAPVRGRSGIER